MPDMDGVTFSESDIGNGVRSYAIHDAQTGKNFAILSDGNPSAEKVRALHMKWLEDIRKAA